MEENEIVETMPETIPEDIPETTETNEPDSGEDSPNTGEDVSVSETVEETTEEPSTEQEPVATTSTLSAGYYYNGFSCQKSSSGYYWYYHDANNDRITIKDLDAIIYVDENGIEHTGTVHPDYVYNGHPAYYSSSGYWYYYDENGGRIEIKDTENIKEYSETEEPVITPTTGTGDDITTVTEVPFLEKPLNEYSVSEGLLLLIFILFFMSFIYHLCISDGKD